MKKKQWITVGLVAAMVLGNLGSSYAAASGITGPGVNAVGTVAEGLTKSGWQKDEHGAWYYLNQTGERATGWMRDVDSMWYYLDTMGVMKTGWFKDADAKWYFLNDNSSRGPVGAMLSNGWYWLDGNGDGIAECYYFGTEGVMYADTRTPDGYYVNENGAWVSAEDGTVYTKDVSGTTGNKAHSSGSGSSSGDSGGSSSSSESKSGNILIGSIAPEYIKAGESSQVKIAAVASNDKPVTVAAKSKDISVASVSVSGSTLYITGVKTGITEIIVSASAEGCKDAEASFLIAVLEEESPELDLGTITMDTIENQMIKVGEEVFLPINVSASNDADIHIKAKSGNPEIAEVSITGDTLMLEGISSGVTLITVTASADQCRDAVWSFAVRVDDIVAEAGTITIGQIPAYTLRAGQEAWIHVTANASNHAQVRLTAESDDPEVASVIMEDNRLTVKGGASGVAVITILAVAEQCENATRTFAVRINDEVTSDELFYGQENNKIVINAADALLNEPYAFHKDGHGVSAETDKNFTWQPAEDGAGIQLLTEEGDNPNENNEWNGESESVQAPRLTFKVNAPARGNYFVSFYSDSPDNGSDAFHIATGRDPEEFTWQMTTKDQMTNGTDEWGTSDQERWYVCNKKTITLNKGVNYIHVAARESGVLLRQIMLSLQNPIFLENKWVKPSELVTGYIDMELPEEDIYLDYGDTTEISVEAAAVNQETVELTAVSGNPDMVDVSGDGRGNFVIEGAGAGNSTVTITASAPGYADVIESLNVVVRDEKAAERDEDGPVDLMVAPATAMADRLTLVWDKPDSYEDITGYEVFQNGESIGETEAKVTHFTVEDLEADTSYEFKIAAIRMGEENDSQIRMEAFSDTIIGRTKPEGEIIDVTQSPYFADAAGSEISTVAVQQAIDDCEDGGTVLIPEGATVLTGALDLKSNMTLQVDGTLQGSNNPEDYLIKPEYRAHYPGLVNDDGLILTRYEGWELYCYRSLLNAGYLNPENRKEVTCQNLTICGKGTIRGQGNGLGGNMKKLYNDKLRYPEYVSDGSGGRRLRGRLLGFIQCKNVHLTGVTVQNPSCWTIHMIYCDTLTTHAISIQSRGVENGDGWDPDSSRNMMIFDTTFDTGDDCIAIKSGKNLDGNIVNMPTRNIRIFDLKMNGGHGMAVGSEQSGGVEGLYIRDCVVDNTNYGLELKANNSRGGYIKDVLIQDCDFDRFMAHSVSYNSDGSDASDLPVFQGITVKNTIIDGYNWNQIKRPVELIGFEKSGHSDPEHEHYVNDVLFENVVLGNEKDSSKTIYLERCQNLVFRNVKTFDGGQPAYDVKDTVYGLSILSGPVSFDDEVEAENMEEKLEEGQMESAFVSKDDPSASNGKYRQLQTDKGALEAIYTGKGGNYINLTGLTDEGASFRLYLNGTEIASWTSQNVGRWYTHSVKVADGVVKDDVIRLEAETTADSAVKLDKLSVTEDEYVAEADQYADVRVAVGDYVKQIVKEQTADGQENAAVDVESGDDTIATATYENSMVKVVGVAEGETEVLVKITTVEGDELESSFTVEVEEAPLNLALNKLVVAMSEESGHTGEKMVDGEVSNESRWTANGGEYPQWVAVDLGAIYEIGSMDILAYTKGRTYNYSIWTATELLDSSLTSGAAIENAKGADFSLLEEFNDAMQQEGHMFDEETEARYLLIDIENASGGYANIAEFGVYGPSSGMLQTMALNATPSNATPSDAEMIVKAAETALDEFEADNETTEDDILDAVETAVSEIAADATVVWNDKMTMVKATSDKKGRITGVIIISYEDEGEELLEVTVEVAVNLSLEKLDDEEILIEEDISADLNQEEDDFIQNESVNVEQEEISSEDKMEEESEETVTDDPDQIADLDQEKNQEDELEEDKKPDSEKIVEETLESEQKEELKTEPEEELDTDQKESDEENLEEKPEESPKADAE